RELPPTLLLFPLPDSQRLVKRDREAILLHYWRLLFHARIHLALQAREFGGRLAERVGAHSRSECASLQAHVISEGARNGIQRNGLTEFDEVTAVLRQERFLLPPGDPRTAYEEFAAVYLELRYFAPHLLSVYFPACTHVETIDATLAL